MRYSRPISTVLLFATVGQLACTSRQVVQPSPAEYVQDRKPRELRIHRSDGSKVELYNPKVEGDSLVGTGMSSSGTRTDERKAYAVADIARADVSRFSAAKTLGLFGVLLGGLLVAAAISCDSNDSYAC